MLRAVPHTPVTSAPSTLAIWTAMVPTPPEAPLIRTRVPAPTCATSRMATSAASPVITDAAASVNVSPAGFLTSWAAGTATYCAKAPARSQVDPSTSSPGTRSVTRPPTASTTPATSLPRTARFGRRSPEAQAADVRHSGDGGPVRGVDTGGPHPDQDVVGADRRHGDLFEPEHPLRRAVAVLDDGTHGQWIDRHGVLLLRVESAGRQLPRLDRCRPAAAAGCLPAGCRAVRHGLPSWSGDVGDTLSYPYDVRVNAYDVRVDFTA